MTQSARPRRLAVVAGGAGFIGRHVCERLRKDHDVVAVGRGTATPRIDATSVAALGAPSLVVLAAGSNSVSRSFEDPRTDFEDTVPPLVHLLDWVRTHAQTARVVLLSSAAVYGDAAEVPTPESTVRTPVSPYGLHRVVAEDLLAGWARTFGLSVVTVRLYSVFGEGLRRQLLWDACVRARRPGGAFSGSGREQRDWLHVSDAAELILRAAAIASAQAPVINGGTGVGTPVRAVVERIHAQLGASPPSFSGEARGGDPTSMIADVRAARALGWVPRVSIDEGVDAYVRWFEALA